METVPTISTLTPAVHMVTTRREAGVVTQLYAGTETVLWTTTYFIRCSNNLAADRSTDRSHSLFSLTFLRVFVDPKKN